jgi:hypothetical protein
MNCLIAPQSMMAINNEMERDEEATGYGVFSRLF